MDSTEIAFHVMSGGFQQPDGNCTKVSFDRKPWAASGQRPKCRECAVSRQAFCHVVNVQKHINRVFTAYKVTLQEQMSPLFEKDLVSSLTATNVIELENASNLDLSHSDLCFTGLTFDHQWLLEPVEGGTKVTQHEVDRGIGLWFWNSDWIEPAYTKVGDALGERVLTYKQ